ncbi:MAG: SUMF1/EgtB/PvdO family nonheme iron enzyme [Pirellulales bacterium]|nr:SUMF1/EgtB/PvdO family nonheme iron enzyme [Pirellulales bacterium]
MNRFTIAFMGIVLLVVLAATAQAVTISHGSTTIDMDFVTVGNTDNVNDTHGDGYGAVDYIYNIGKYEVSENQWDAVCAASATDLLDDPGYWSGDQAVAHISWNEAAMFCNWLTSGDVTDGAYTIDGSGVVTAIDRDSAISTHGTVYVIPTEDEWYKAAYYDGDAGVYYDYPTGSNTKPDGIDFSEDPEFDAVFADFYDQGQPNDVDNAGALLSPYGTMGQGGNVWEWNETGTGSSRGTRGASWRDDAISLAASTRGDDLLSAYEHYILGFRVASVPEPGDATGDGKVDVSDLGVLASNYGTTSGAEWDEGDFTGEGAVDVSDLGVLASHYGFGTTVASVPEPNTIILLLCGIATLLCWRRRK